MRKRLIPLLGVISFAILGSASGCNNGQKDVQAEENTVNTEVKETPAEEPMAEIERKNYKVKISTEYGDMIAILYDETPLHRDNFVKLVNEGFYNDLLFHRVMQNFMIQGGDPDSRDAAPGKHLGMGGPGYTTEAEFRPELYHKKGALAAARQPDNVNPQRRSSGSQFYISQGRPVPDQQLVMMEMQRNARRDSTNQLNYTDEQIKVYTELGGTPHLDGEYTVFGEVIEGMEVIDKIAAVQVDRANRPLQDVKMTITVVE